MTYGFRPENWPAFQAELQRRGINAAGLEKVEMRPTEAPGDSPGDRQSVDITVTLRSGCGTRPSTANLRQSIFWHGLGPGAGVAALRDSAAGQGDPKWIARSSADVSR